MFQSTLVDNLERATPLPEAEATYGTLVSLAAAAHRAGGGAGLSVEAMSHLAWSTVHGLSMLLIEGALRGKPPHLIVDDAALTQQVVGGLSRLLALPAREHQPIDTGSAARPPRAPGHRRR